MPRYFFHPRDGRTQPDATGSEFPSLAAARVEAVRMAGELLKWQAETFWNEAEWSLEVTDEKGLTLFTLHFLAVDAPTLRLRESIPRAESA